MAIFLPSKKTNKFVFIDDVLEINDQSRCIYFTWATLYSFCSISIAAHKHLELLPWFGQTACAATLLVLEHLLDHCRIKCLV